MNHLNPPQQFNSPLIKDDDIAWACKILCLPSHAFSGPDGNDPRQDILKSNETLDIEACPGSGKTTLLVAKLAILAKKWTDITRGICVLSHTNVAREEIEQRLGNTAEGQKLLSYPHYIGTIHGFTNEFLAIPWLRSKGYQIKVIDNEAAQNKRWNKIPFKFKNALQNSGYGPEILHIKDVDFGLGDIRWGAKGGVLGRSSDTYVSMQQACKLAMEEGYFCHDEMFLWAYNLLKHQPNVVSALRQRFPILFLDEVQDNSEAQSEILYKIFVEGSQPVRRQRFGDSNQAIYNSIKQSSDAHTDPFPDFKVRKDILNSFRFNQDIADFANPLGLIPQGLIGLKGLDSKISTNKKRKHTIFLFSDASIEQVLNAYAGYLLEVFSENDIKNGSFTAVGAVHQAPFESDNLPRSVVNYWSEYDATISRSDPKPNTFIQYVAAGHRQAFIKGLSFPCIEKISEGILRLAFLLSPSINLGDRRRKHRFLLELLSEKIEIRELYLNTLQKLAIQKQELTQELWASQMREQICKIAEAISGNKVIGSEANSFLNWSQIFVADNDTPLKALSSNLFHFPAENPKIKINVSSIHAVKGQTHTATLVFETFYHTHHLKSLLPWLLGEKVGGQKEGVRNKSRLKLHYVAMTRPSHLLCLAMREDAFTETEVETLSNKGWRVIKVQTSADS